MKIIRTAQYYQKYPYDEGYYNEQMDEDAWENREDNFPEEENTPEDRLLDALRVLKDAIREYSEPMLLELSRIIAAGDWLPTFEDFIRKNINTIIKPETGYADEFYGKINEWGEDGDLEDFLKLVKTYPKWVEHTFA